jgi:hypothetical protein
VLKNVIPGNEIGLAVEFNKSSPVLALRQRKQPLGGRASRLLRRQHLPSFPQLPLRRLCQTKPHFYIQIYNYTTNNSKKKKLKKEIKRGFRFGPMSQLLSIRAALTSLMGALVRSLSCFIRFIWFEEEEPSELNLLETFARPPPHREWAYVQLLFSSLL